MRTFRKTILLLLSAVLCAGIAVIGAPSAGASTPAEVLPPGGGPASAWHYKTFTTSWEGGSQTCRTWLRRPDHQPDSTSPVVAHAAFTCPHWTNAIAGTFVLQAEGYPAQVTQGPIWAGPCSAGIHVCWKYRSAVPHWVYAFSLSEPHRTGLQLAYDSLSLYDPFNQCPGPDCLTQTWRVQR